MRVALATCIQLPEPDFDEQLTVDAFRERGHDVEMLAWDDPGANPVAHDVVIIRSTWDYPERPDAFAEWVTRTAKQTRLLNPSEAVLGNVDKRYLRDLQNLGLPVVPTIWVHPGDDLTALIEKPVVIKPTIGAGSMDARRFEPEQRGEAQAWLDGMAADRLFMVQPYLDSVATVGEQSIVMVGGVPTHRIRKHPRFFDQHESVEGPFPVDGAMAELARRAVESYGPLLYARVDVMQADDGRWLISEVELIEPSLFFLQNPDALGPFVAATEAMVGSHQPQ